MIAHQLKTSLRNLVENKWISFINIIGLSTGMAVCILIAWWMWDEVSFDRDHVNYQTIGKVRLNVRANGEVTTSKTVPLPLVFELAAKYKDEFQYVVPSSHKLNHILSYGEKQLFKKGVYLGSDAIAMLSLKMKRGDAGALVDPHSIILSESTAREFFGNNDVLGQVLNIDHEQQVKVTGVYEDLPENASFADVEFVAPFDLYLSNETWLTAMNDSWSRTPVQLYVQLSPTTNFKSAGDRISKIVQHNIEETTGRSSTVILEPMSKWHLYAYKDGLNNTGSIRYVRMFGIIGICVLLLACFNFMNLGTARSEKRANEVGVRKALGSFRSQLISQFLTESVLLALGGFIIAIALVVLMLPFFNDVTGKKLGVLWSNTYFWIVGLALSVITGLLAGSYPAFFLSSFRPVEVLKGTFRTGSNAGRLRKALVVVQFAVSAILIVCTIVVARQIQHARLRPSGYVADNLVLIPMTAGDVREHFDLIRTDLIKKRLVMNMAGSESTTTDIWGTDSDLEWKGKDPDVAVDIPNTGVSVEYGETVGWSFIEGRDFSKAFASDSAGFILNEAAVKYMGLQHPIGELIRWKGNTFTVIGVIKDMIMESPYDPVKPSIYCLARRHDNFAIAKLNAGLPVDKVLSGVEATFKKYSPSTPFQYEFIDDKYNQKFGSEDQVAKLAGYFSALAILISCLGIFAMSAFMAERRAREVSIRKVFGASVYSIWKMMSGEFAGMMIWSLVFSIPVSYFLMRNWLNNYHYRTTITWWIFGVAALGILLITLMTTSYQTIKAALSNPGKILRDE